MRRRRTGRTASGAMPTSAPACRMARMLSRRPSERCLHHAWSHSHVKKMLRALEAANRGFHSSPRRSNSAVFSIRWTNMFFLVVRISEIRHWHHIVGIPGWNIGVAAHDAEQFAVHHELTAIVVLHETALAELVHKMAHPRPRGPDHLRQGLLVDTGANRFRLAFPAHVRQQ